MEEALEELNQQLDPNMATIFVFTTFDSSDQCFSLAK